MSPEARTRPSAAGGRATTDEARRSRCPCARRAWHLRDPQARGRFRPRGIGPPASPSVLLLPLAVTALAPRAGPDIPGCRGRRSRFLALLGRHRRRVGGAGAPDRRVAGHFWGALAIAITAGVGALVGAVV